MLFPELVGQLSDHLAQRSMTLSCAESCTGGLIAASITDRPGSSAIFDRGFVTYSNESKIEQIAVPEWVISVHGAVSHECAGAMVRGVLDFSDADIALATTGIAGPGGATDDKPVGLVYIACMRRGHEPVIERHVFTGDRQAVRSASVERALRLAIEMLAV